MKKEATPKHMGLKTKTSDEKIRNPKMQGAQNKSPPMKKEATPKRKGLKTKTFDKKEATPKYRGLNTKAL
jgi:hypothetical protein